MIDRQQLGDHAAHRCADNMGGADTKCIEDARGVVGHVLEGIGCMQGDMQEVMHHVAQAPRGFCTLDFRRQANIAIIEANDIVASLDERITEVRRPGNHLRAEAHDQQDRVAARVPERVVFDCQSVGL
jgi:hypothetical protein